MDEDPCIKTECDCDNGNCTKIETQDTYCDSSYSLFSWTFGIVMMGVACLDLSFLSAIQGCLSLFAFSALSIMITTTLIAINFDTGDDVGWDALPETDLSGLGALITCAVTSQLCHQGVPTLLHMLRKKRKARFVFSVSLFYTFSMYVILCLSTSIFFGPSISPIVTLNWERYSGGAKHGTAIPWWASGLSYMVLLFPVVSVSAAFPLQLVVISGILSKAFGGSGPPGPWSHAPLRIMCCFVAVCLAQAVNSVSLIIAANGSVAILIGFILPCLLHICARKASIRRWGKEAGKTPYWSNTTSHPAVVCFLLFCSILIGIFALVQAFEMFLHYR